jgi:hypothetical protein
LIGRFGHQAAQSAAVSIHLAVSNE